MFTSVEMPRKRGMSWCCPKPSNRCSSGRIILGLVLVADRLQQLPTPVLGLGPVPNTSRSWSATGFPLPLLSSSLQYGAVLGFSRRLRRRGCVLEESLPMLSTRCDAPVLKGRRGTLYSVLRRRRSRRARHEWMCETVFCPSGSQCRTRSVVQHDGALGRLLHVAESCSSGSLAGAEATARDSPGSPCSAT